MIKQQVYCDLDGVLVDFEGGLPPFINQKIYEFFFKKDEIKYQKPKLYRMIQQAIVELGGNFDSGDIPKMNFEDFEKKAGKKKLRNLSYMIVEMNDEEFWSNLKWLPDGKHLWKFIEKFNPIILSSPIGKANGKYLWCQKNLGLNKNKVVLTYEKYKYAQNSILIDDMEKNTKPFIDNGGLAILHKTAEQTIAQLKEVIKDEPS